MKGKFKFEHESSPQNERFRSCSLEFDDFKQKNVYVLLVSSETKLYLVSSAILYCLGRGCKVSKLFSSEYLLSDEAV